MVADGEPLWWMLLTTTWGCLGYRIRWPARSCGFHIGSLGCFLGHSLLGKTCVCGRTDIWGYPGPGRPQATRLWPDWTPHRGGRELGQAGVAAVVHHADITQYVDWTPNYGGVDAVHTLVYHMHIICIPFWRNKIVVWSWRPSLAGWCGKFHSHYPLVYELDTHFDSCLILVDKR